MIRGPSGLLVQSDLPTKTPYAGEPGHIRLRKIDCWTCFKSEIGKSLIRPEGSKFVLSIQPPTAVYGTRVPGFPD